MFVCSGCVSSGSAGERVVIGLGSPIKLLHDGVTLKDIIYYV